MNTLILSTLDINRLFNLALELRVPTDNEIGDAIYFKAINAETIELTNEEYLYLIDLCTNMLESKGVNYIQDKKIIINTLNFLVKSDNNILIEIIINQPIL